MEPVKIKLEGKIYILDFSKLTQDKIKRLLTLEPRVDEDIDAKHEAIEIITGIEREKLAKLKKQIINTITKIITKEAEKIIRFQSH